ncbi:MAG: VWA domain-containing protein, partial [Pricia sp.]
MMDIETILLIILAAMVAMGMVLFQYYYRTKRKGRLTIVLSFLRFLVFFAVFLLLINPEFTKNEYRIEKADLIVLVDNSTSVATSEDTIRDILGKISENQALNDRFNIVRYGFGAELMTGKGAGNTSQMDTTSSSGLTSFSLENTDITAA